MVVVTQKIAGEKLSTWGNWEFNVQEVQGKGA